MYDMNEINDKFKHKSFWFIIYFFEINNAEPKNPNSKT